MRLTGFTDYAVRVLIYLALTPRRHATIADMALAHGVSVNHLMKVVAHLRAEGDIETLRGQHGGIRLARLPEAISLGAVVRRAEPDMDVVPCFRSEASCRMQPACEVSRILAEATRAFLEVLDRYTLADLVAGRQHRLGQLLGVQPVGYPVAVALPSATEIAWDRVGPSGSSPEP